MSQRILAVALLGGLCLIGASTYFTYQQLDTPEPPAAQVAPPVAVDSSVEQSRALNRQLRDTSIKALPDPGPLPASLQGAQHGVSLYMSEDGQLILQEDLLHLFDFYLAGGEEDDLARLLQRIHRDLAAQLNGVALDQARDLLRRYVDYRIALADLPRMPRTLEPTQLRQRLAALDAMRRSHFSAEEVEVFFANQYAEDSYSIQRLEITQSDLDPQRRQQALDALDQQLPETLRQARQQSTSHADLYATTRQLQADGASAEEVRRLREERLGTQAADALTQLDQQQAQWQTRLSDYAAERNRLRSAGLAERDLQQAIDALQARSFDERERLRVRALDGEL